jgi:HupE / UreJ protein
MMDRRCSFWITVLTVCALAASVSRAHPAHMVAADAKIEADGRFRVRATFDLLAFALNDTPSNIDDASTNELLDGPADLLEQRLEQARNRFLNHFTALCGEQQQTIVRAEMTRFPTVGDVQRWRESGIVPRLPVLLEATVEGRLPDAATSVAFRFPPIMGTVVLTVERPGEEPCSEPVEAGRASSPLPLRAAAPARPGWLHAAARFVALGFTHIVPAGPDHILFLLGLFLLSTRLRPLLWQVTAFTAAHSITLALALYGVVRLPPIVVEPLIALSIAFVAVENLFTTNLKPWRPFVVFGFGLIHGLGFAGVLMEMGLPRAQFGTALVSFNIGVELGQLAVIALAFAAVGWWRRRGWYRAAIVLPASTTIAAVALFWTIQRVWAGI